MSESFICRRGGSGKVFAVIGVTYPEGSTCTCTDGKKTFTAKGTSGRATFIIPYAATWTVTCTNGEDTTSQDVSITTEGQTETVVLSYELVLYNAGAYDASTGGWSGSSSDTVLTAQSHSAYNSFIYTNNEIDLSSYSLLTVRITDIHDPYGGTAAPIVIGAATAASSSSVNFAASTQTPSGTLSTPTNFNVDISALTGSYYIAIQVIGDGLGSDPRSSSVTADYVVLT